MPIWTWLERCGKQLIVVLPVTMVLGLAFGLVTPAGGLKALIVPFTFLMVYPMMVNLRPETVLKGGDGRTQGIALAVNFGVMPFVSWGIGRLFFADQPALALGLLLAGLMPTSGMTISYTGFAKGNMAAAVKMTVLGLVLGALATPYYTQWLLGDAIQLDITKVFQQIALIVFLPMAAGYGTRRALVARLGEAAFRSVWAPRMPGLSTLGVLGIVFVAMALKARSIAEAPQLLGFILLPIVLVYSLNFLLSTLIGKALLPRGDAVALVFGTVMRNLSIALAVAMGALGESGQSAALVIAIAYIVQVQSAAWYVKFADRIFGSPPVSDTLA